MSRDLLVRVEETRMKAAPNLMEIRLSFAEIVLGTETVWAPDHRFGPTSDDRRRHFQDIADRLNAVVGERIKELLEANSAEVERRRQAEAERDAALVRLRRADERITAVQADILRDGVVAELARSLIVVWDAGDAEQIAAAMRNLRAADQIATTGARR